MQEDGPFEIAQLPGDACMVAARGELDGSTAWRLQDALGAATATGSRRLIADFAAVTYLDADAVAVLSGCAAHIFQKGATLVVVTDDPWLLRLLDAGHLEGVEFEPTLRDVVRQLPLPTAVV